MKIFTEDITKVQDEIENAITKVEKTKSPDKIRDIAPVINCLNEALKSVDTEMYESNIENFGRIDNFSQKVAAYKTMRNNLKSLISIDRNIPIISYVSNQILSDIQASEVLVDYDLITKQNYTEDEMNKLILKYFYYQCDLTSVEIFNKLINDGSIYNLKLDKNINAVVTHSHTLNKAYILLENNHDFKTIVNLVHEIGHLKEWCQLDNLHHLIKYKECNDFVEVAAKHTEKQFLEFLSKDKTHKEEAINMHYANYREFLILLDVLLHMKNEPLTEEELYDQAVYTLSVYGDIFSDILLSVNEDIREGFYQSLAKRKNLLITPWDFEAFGLTPYGAARKVVKQYKKYR